MAFFALMALSVFTWIRFFVAYLEMSGRARAWLLGTGRATLAFFAAALAANPFTDAFFAVDAGCVYSEGPLRDIALGLLIAVNALGSAITLYELFHTEGAARRRNAMVSVFGAVMIAAIAMQLGEPLLPLYSLGCMFGCCFLHVFVIEGERDAMHRKELLAHSLEAKLEAERAANRAKSLFFSSVSHDIRTPLNAILGFSELLEQGVPGEEDRIRYTSSIRSSGKVLARLVDDILDLSKLECGKLEICNEPTDVPALVREVIAACEIARARKSLALKTTIAGVATAENGLRALEILKKDPEIDLVLTDLWMPEMDGTGLVSAIRADARLAWLPVYLVTADVEAPKDGESAGFTGILLKPVSIASLAPLFAQTPAPAPTSAARS